MSYHVIHNPIHNKAICYMHGVNPYAASLIEILYGASLIQTNKNAAQNIKHLAMLHNPY